MAHKRFKITTDAGKNFFWAYVFDTKEEMQAWYRNRRLLEDAGDFRAMVMPYEAVRFQDGQEVRRDDIGTAIFWRGGLGAGTVAHEMGHCAIWYDRLVNGNRLAEYGESIGDAEERMLYLLYDFVRCFVDKCYKLKLL